MDPLRELGDEPMQAVLQQAEQLAEQFLSTLHERPLRGSGTPPTNEFPELGIGSTAALTKFWQQWEHTLSASPGPRYFGFVTGGSTPAALAGDWLTSCVDQNAQKGNDSCSAQLEVTTVRWLCQAIGLPDTFTGGFVTGATMANLCGLAIGRQHLGVQRGIDVAAHGWQGTPLRILSGAIHASTVKACSVLGIGSAAVEVLTTLPAREAVDVQALEHALQQHQNNAVIVVANAGTVNTVDFDDITAIAALKSRYKFWLHVDAAFGGVAAFSERYRPLLGGWHQADSITIDAHKWLNVPYDSAMILTQHLDTQLSVFQNRSRYLAAPACLPDNFLHLMPENSRRWRALPLYMNFLAYGRQGIAAMVERHVALTQQLAAGISMIKGLELLAPAHLNGVCFSLNSHADSDRNAFLQRLYQDNKCYFTPTLHEGRPAIRGALVNWRTQAHDIEITLQSLAKCV